MCSVRLHSESTGHAAAPRTTRGAGENTKVTHTRCKQRSKRQEGLSITRDNAKSHPCLTVRRLHWRAEVLKTADRTAFRSTPMSCTLYFPFSLKAQGSPQPGKSWDPHQPALTPPHTQPGGRRDARTAMPTRDTPPESAWTRSGGGGGAGARGKAAKGGQRPREGAGQPRGCPATGALGGGGRQGAGAGWGASHGSAASAAPQ